MASRRKEILMIALLLSPVIAAGSLQLVLGGLSDAAIKAIDDGSFPLMDEELLEVVDPALLGLAGAMAMMLGLSLLFQVWTMLLVLIFGIYFVGKK